MYFKDLFSFYWCFMKLFYISSVLFITAEEQNESFNVFVLKFINE